MDYGSTVSSGRWHVVNPSLSVVYCGCSRAICQLEKRVHANGARIKDQAMFRLTLPPSAVILDAESLGLNTLWRDDMSITQGLGMDWLASRASLALSVPSFIEPLERNVLLNPKHVDYRKVTLAIERQPFTFDIRLFQP